VQDVRPNADELAAVIPSVCCCETALALVRRILEGVGDADGVAYQRRTDETDTVPTAREDRQPFSLSPSRARGGHQALNQGAVSDALSQASSVGVTDVEVDAVVVSRRRAERMEIGDADRAVVFHRAGEVADPVGPTWRCGTG